MSDELTNGISRRRMLADALNNAGLGDKLQEAKGALLQTIITQMTYLANKSVPEIRAPEQGSPEFLQNEVKLMLNSVGPAAASAAVTWALGACQRQGKLKGVTGTDFVMNTKMILNDPGDGLPSFSNALRQFLLPRYAYLDFDIIVDPRHRVDLECGYPRFITPIMYRYLYDRDDVAARVVDFYADETWGSEPCIYDDEDENVETPFEAALRELNDKHKLLQMLYRLDKLSGVGHYGALLIAVDDGQDLEKPLQGIGPDGSRVGNRDYKLLFMRPFDEYLSFIMQYDTDPNSPRYGQPVIYNLIFLDMTIDAAGASIGSRLNRRVHWTRIVPVAQDRQSSLVFGIPRMQRVFNRLLDLRKIKGGDAESMWKCGFPGIAFEVDPQYIADEPDFDREAFKQEVEDFSNSLRKFITLEGIKANTLQHTVADPKPHVMVQLEAIAMAKNIPLRMFIGSEEGRQAGAQDILTMNRRLGRHIRMFTTPELIRGVIDRFVALGILPPPKDDRYYCEWPDLNTPTDEDKANLALKWSQAISQYVASGMVHIIGPMDYLTNIVGLKPAVAKRIIDALPAGSLGKLMKVDPSQAAGVNGKRTAPASVQEDGTATERPTPRNSGDKMAEGTAS